MSPDNHDLALSELRTLSAQEVADATGVPIESRRSGQRRKTASSTPQARP
jgi:hypothetical protein